MVTKDLGFVIKRYNFRETSVIASFYTQKYGKITGILKGFYTQKKEFASHLGSLSLNEIVFYPKKSDVWLVSFADLVCDYGFLRSDLARASVASVFLNLVDKTMQPLDKNLEVFELLRDSLFSLKEESAQKSLYVFLIKFLTISGFKPEFGKCLICHEPASGETHFSVSRGGLVCKKCKTTEQDIRRIGADTMASLFYIQNNDFPLALRIKPTPECEKEMVYLLREFLCCHLDIDISMNT
ncbi:MAG: DNA repair protein RecO [Candidatus Omnitrophica bacterium]|nr:DNA repair protein RecO [Candidatus Omnitrophota bacterium]